MRRVVTSTAEAEAILLAMEHQLRDMSSFFRKLEEPSGALDVSERETWDKRFRMGVRHADSTIAARARAKGGQRRDRSGRFKQKALDYYQQNQPGPRATRSAPFLEWTGSLRRAASKFTTINANSASIDPDANYQGPLDGLLSDPFSTLVSEIVPDDRIFDETILGRRIDRELTSFLLKRLAG